MSPGPKGQNLSGLSKIGAMVKKLERFYEKVPFLLFYMQNQPYFWPELAFQPTLAGKTQKSKLGSDARNPFFYPQTMARKILEPPGVM